jgi:hypothetical protein
MKLRWWTRPAKKEQAPPLRRIVGGHTAMPAEHIELECGHTILVRYHRIAEYPCEQCAAEPQEKL